MHFTLCTHCSCDQNNFTKMFISLHSQCTTHYNTHKFQHLKYALFSMPIYANLAYTCLQKCYYCCSPELLLLLVTTMINKLQHFTWLSSVIINTTTSQRTHSSNRHKYSHCNVNVTSSAFSTRMYMGQHEKKKSVVQQA
jgi:hypothetical protein